ncbi:RodZ domain-containing protein [Neisseria leonii]|uniref:RodZ domain-containing protein n=1 Tax=Neisseria leonii TaxID=2995413 RepID=UPI00237AD315|nr:RodZ domain-containing protein [Neisseria sp. 3986]MDD9325299.1 helix-turn-helix domain-containing protein [Neisseria sp. 3986]
MDHTQENGLQPQAAAAELGARLREARERKGLSIGEVAERLKLPARQVESLESGDYRDLPELVFVRGFLRTYSRFLELDEQQTADSLDRIAPIERKNHYAAAREEGDKDLNFQHQTVKKPFPTWIFGVLAVAAIAVGVFAWQSKSNAENQRQEAAGASEVGLGEIAAPNVEAGNVAVVAMASEPVSGETQASAVSDAQQAAVQTASEPQADAVAADELLINVRYRSMLVVKDKEGNEVINQIVPARSEHRFKGGAPYNVWIGYALGAEVNYGGRRYSVPRHMVGKKSASLMVGEP